MVDAAVVLVSCLHCYVVCPNVKWLLFHIANLHLKDLLVGWNKYRSTCRTVSAVSKCVDTIRVYIRY